MLPFLKRKDIGQPILSVKTRTPDQPEETDAMHEVAKNLISAIQSNDIKSVADALRAACNIADSEPHDEGTNTDESNE